MSGAGTDGPAGGRQHGHGDESLAEVGRLRELIGPDEESYLELRRQRDGAEAHARELETQLGVLRAQVKRLDQIMWRRTARRQRMTRLARRFIRRA